MATPAQNITIGADISQLEAGVGRFVQLMGMQSQAIEGVMIKQVKFNENTKRWTATAEASLTANKKLITTLQQDSNASWNVHTAAIKNTSKSMDEFNKNAEKTRKFLLTPADFARIAEATLFKQALTSITSAMSESVVKAKEFQIQISLIRTVSQSAQLGFAQWSNGITDVSNKLGIDLVEVSKAAYDAIQSQVVVGAQTFQFLESAGNLARTTGTDIKQSGDLLASTIQGFKLSITETDRVAAILFKTVELGRIEISELSNTFGKVAPSAQVIGIKFEEVAAAFATLTRQGIKTNDASTLLTNVILKLAKPTENMKKLMAEWGFASSQAAVQTLGFVNVLKRLEGVTDGRLDELAELFNELRGLRGAVGLTSAFDQYESDLNNINNAQETFLKAQEIRAESSADALNRYGQTVKNTFVGVFGQEVLGIMKSFTNVIGDAETATTILTKAVIYTAIGATALKTLTITLNVAGAAFTALQARQAGATAGQIAYTQAIAAGASVEQAAIIRKEAHTTAVTNFTQSQVQSRAAMTNAIGTTATLIVALGSIKLAYDAINDSAQGTEKYLTNDNIRRIAEGIRTVDPKKLEDQARSNLSAFTSNVDSAFKIPLLASANLYKEANANLIKLEDQSKKLGETFGISYKTYIDGLRDGMKEMNKEISKSQANIRESQKSLGSFKNTLDQIVRDTQFQYATESQKSQLAENEISKLYKEAQADFEAGRTTEGREKTSDIARLIKDNFDRDQDRNKAQLEQYLRDNPNAAALGTALTVETVPMQERLNSLLAFRNQMEEKYQQSQAEVVKSKQKLVNIEEKRIKDIELAAKKFIEFDITKNGKVQDKYKTDGKVDMKKVQDDLFASVADIQKLAPESAGSLDLYSKLWDRVSGVIKEANANINRDITEQDQRRIDKAKTMMVEKFRTAQTEIANASQRTFAKGGALEQLGADAGSSFDFARARQSNSFLGINNEYFNLNGSHQKTVSESNEIRALAEKQLALVKEQEDVIRRNATNVQGQLLPRKEDIVKYQELLNGLNTQVEKYIRLRTPDEVKSRAGFNIDDIQLPRDDGIKLRFGDVKDDQNKQLKALNDAADKGVQQEGTLQGLENNLKQFYQEQTKPLFQKMPELLFEGSQAIKATKGSFDEFKATLDGANESSERLRKSLSNIMANQNISTDGVVGDDAQYYNTGGPVHPGKPRGQDIIPAWLTPGEFIMPASQTRQFYSQLMDMRKGIQPRYYNHGGYVSTNIGDVHVHMGSGGSAEASPTRMARKIGRELRREMKRGNTRL